MENRLINTKYNYYYIGENLKYDLLIVKNIGSTYEEFLNKIDYVALASWKLECIWEDRYNNYDELYKLCSMLKINISKDPDYILVNKQENSANHCEYNYLQINNIFIFKQILSLMRINKVKLKEIDIDILNQKFQQFEHLSKIVDLNTISIINQYLITDMNIYKEIMCVKYNNVSRDIIEYLTTNFNIYKIEKRYFLQINSVFCEVNEIGIPISDYCRKSYYDEQFCTHNYDISKPNNGHPVGMCSKIPLMKILINNTIYESRNYSSHEHINECLYSCQFYECHFKYILFENLKHICQKIYNVPNNTDNRKYYIKNISFYNKKRKYNIIYNKTEIYVE